MRLVVWMVVAAMCALGAVAIAKETKQRPLPQACRGPGECELIPKACCAQCGGDTDVEAVNSSDFEESGRPECAGAKCAECSDDDEPRADRAHQRVPVCEKRRCAVLRLDTMPITRCQKDAECVAIPSACCSSVGVAVRRDKAEALAERMCAGVGCPANVRILPPAACRAGRCVMVTSSSR